MRYVIVGNSAAAGGAVEGIRALDADGEITLIASEREHTYSRPLISYLLAGKVDQERMNYRPADFYVRHRVKTFLGEEVVGIDAEHRTVTTHTGKRFEYDRLLLATGGRPIVPPTIKGLDAQGVFTFTTWDDARQIEAALSERHVKEAVVLGGGKPMFPHLRDRINLQLVESRQFGGGVVLLRYQVVPKPTAAVAGGRKCCHFSCSFFGYRVALTSGSMVNWIFMSR